METKKCSKCREEKPATAEYFYRQKGQRYGLRPECKACKAKYNDANHTHIIEKTRQYRAANRGRCAENLRRWRKANPERVTHNQRVYIDANRELVRTWNRRRKARKRNALGSHTPADIEVQYKAQKGLCYYCKTQVGSEYHVDHVIPLSRGGSNGPENLVIACPPCNLSKHDKLPHEWAQYGRLL